MGSQKKNALQAELPDQLLDGQFVVCGNRPQDGPQRAQLDRAVIGHGDMVLAAALSRQANM